MRKYLYFVLAALTYLVVHEGIHVMLAKHFGIYQGIRILPLGIEVLVTQPLSIDGFKLAAFSGLSSVVTVVIGLMLLAFSSRILKLNIQPIKNYFYYVTLVFMLLDPVYISILSFFVGGDINGIALGLNIPFILVRIIFFFLALVNAYLVGKKLYPAYVIKQ